MARAILQQCVQLNKPFCLQSRSCPDNLEVPCEVITYVNLLAEQLQVTTFSVFSTSSDTSEIRVYIR